jgi:hypothetical protein
VVVVEMAREGVTKTCEGVVEIARVGNIDKPVVAVAIVGVTAVAVAVACVGIDFAMEGGKERGREEAGTAARR